MFTLKRIQIKKHKVLKDVNLSFCGDDNRSKNQLYSSVIIGPNGVGKSILLKSIVEIFCYLRHYQQYPRVNKYLSYSFIIEYCLNGNDYVASNSNTTMHNGRIPYVHTYCLKNNIEIPIEDLPIPAKIIASTMTVTDKFSSQSNDLYQYRGVRNERSQTTSTRSLVRRTVDGIIDGINTKNDFREELGDLMAHLNFKKEMYVTYNTKYRDVFFAPNMTASKLEDIFDNWENYFTRTTAPWGIKNFNSIRKDRVNLELIAEFLAKQSLIMKTDNHTYVSYDVFADNKIGEDKNILNWLSQMDILTYPTLHVKKDDVYQFQESSSGESQLLCQFIGVLSSINQDSLVIIDEPENSCHPEWQMHYIDWLKETFRRYSSCHFIIATHSPAILMNLKPKESTILPLKRSAEGICINEKSEASNTFSWRYEDLLIYTMTMPSIRTELFDEYMNSFEQAIQNKNAQDAKKYYDLLIAMMRPDDVLREILQIKRIGLL